MFAFKKIFSKSQSKKKEESLYTALSEKTPSLWQRLSSAFVGKSTLSEEVLEEMEELLYVADIGFETVSKILDTFKKKYQEASKSKKEFGVTDYKHLLYESTIVLFPATAEQTKTLPIPYTLMVVGVNGVGKTTSIAKLSYLFQQEGKQVIIGAGDTFRAGAIDQLAKWSERLNIPLIKRSHLSDPASVCYDTIESALAQQKDIAIIDTAGRLHTNENLMSELQKMVKVMRKKIPEAPHDTLLVIDGTMGKNALEQAKQFSSITPLSGIVVTKLDGSAKGGTLISIADILSIPIVYMGVGENVEDLVPFQASAYLKKLFQIESEGS